MKILFSLHDLALGGTTINAIDLAVALRDRYGHDVALFASPGPMETLVREAALRYLPAPVATGHPSPARMQALRVAVRQYRPDIANVWETWACLDAYCSVHLSQGLPLLVTDMQMQLTRVLPTMLTTTFGTPELVDQARASGRPHAELLLPPVDTQLNAPGVVDPEPLRRRCGVRPGEIVLVTVSRLVRSLKGESLHRSIDAVRVLGKELPLRLIIVGDGSARAEIELLAAQANAKLGREAVVLPGAMLDPRAAYAAADIVIGMGGSALRAMAFAKPTIVVGEQSFAKLLDAERAAQFLYKGLYGIGRGDADANALADEIRRAVNTLQSTPSIGEVSRQFVQNHFSLEVVAAHLARLAAAAADRPTRRLSTSLDTLRTAAVYMRERRYLWRSTPPVALRAADFPS